jgi:hypothetical protein
MLTPAPNTRNRLDLSQIPSNNEIGETPRRSGCDRENPNDFEQEKAEKAEIAEIAEVAEIESIESGIGADLRSSDEGAAVFV